jgi:hypothetical protein
MMIVLYHIYSPFYLPPVVPAAKDDERRGFPAGYDDRKGVTG